MCEAYYIQSDNNDDDDDKNTFVYLDKPSLTKDADWK